MIQRKTVLILGAGASTNYGPAVGSGLLQQVLETCRNPNDGVFDKFLSYEGIDISLATGLAALIEQSPVRSIDVLLEHRAEYREVGKAAIAYRILASENRAALFGTHAPDGRWYKYLFERLYVKNLKDFARNRLSVVTFNYDRTLERFLRTSMINLYDVKGEAEACELLRAIPIVHVHGQVGSLEDLELVDHAIWKPPAPKEFKKAKDGIKIISEITDPANDADFQLARDLIRESEQIIFLGFGFHTENIERLHIKGPFKNAPSATGYDMTEGETKAVDDMFSRALDWGKADENIHRFLRRVAVLR